MFVGNIIQYNEFVTWLAAESTPENVCVISGSSGCGKTYGINSAATQTSKLVTLFDSTTIVNGRDFKDKLTKSTQSHVLAQFTQTSFRDRLIVIDELDALMVIDRTFMSYLKGISHSVKVVVAGTHEAANKITIPHRRISLNAASEADILLFLKAHYGYKGQKAKTLLKAAESCNGNIGLALKCTPKFGVSDAFPDIASVYRNTEAAHQVFSGDSWLNPLRFHENLIHELKQRTQPRSKPRKQDVYSLIMRDFCNWDVLMSKDVSLLASTYISLAVKRLDALKLKKNPAPVATDFTKMINMLSVRKKAVVALYVGSANAFPWHEITSYEKNFLQRK